MPVIDTDELTAQELLEMLQMAALNAYPRDREKFVAACPLTPDNLVGSYFRAPDQDDPDAEALWLAHESCKMIEGLVVAEAHKTPLTATYLVEYFGAKELAGGGREVGAMGHQQLIDLERMREQRWLFYDSEDWLASGGQPLGKAPKNAKEALRQEQREQKG